MDQFARSAIERLVSALGKRSAARQSTVEVPLTAREVEVLRLIAGCATNREIAHRLVVGDGTVNNHVSSIRGRLGLRNRTQAAIYAHEHLLP